MRWWILAATLLISGCGPQTPQERAAWQSLAAGMNDLGTSLQGAAASGSVCPAYSGGRFIGAGVCGPGQAQVVQP